MKKQLYVILIFLSSMAGFAQQDPITIKKEQVFLNGTPILRYEKVNAKELSIYNLQGEEIIAYFIKNVASSSQYDEHYVVINFLKERIKVTCDLNPHLSTAFGIDKARNAEKLLNWLYELKVLNVDGTINPEKAEAFQWKYNDGAVGGIVRD
ncbi:hypothetical protein ACLI09_12195 [Flavobacterium sp. RHBU_24]|uniref:hypothetical protein n=1 Tax=Flavobacterium sp. RHBU_24 TaxID=3391185 RepID=UPI00398519D5